MDYTLGATKSVLIISVLIFRSLGYHVAKSQVPSFALTSSAVILVYAICM